MHSGVGAACCSDSDRLAGDGRKRTLQMILDSVARGLRLPAMEVAAVVFDPDRYFHGSDGCALPGAQKTNPGKPGLFEISQS